MPHHLIDNAHAYISSTDYESAAIYYQQAKNNSGVSEREQAIASSMLSLILLRKKALSIEECKKNFELAASHYSNDGWTVSSDQLPLLFYPWEKFLLLALADGSFTLDHAIRVVHSTDSVTELQYVIKHIVEMPPQQVIDKLNKLSMPSNLMAVMRLNQTSRFNSMQYFCLVRSFMSNDPNVLSCNWHRFIASLHTAGIINDVFLIDNISNQTISIALLKYLDSMHITIADLLPHVDGLLDDASKDDLSYLRKIQHLSLSNAPTKAKFIFFKLIINPEDIQKIFFSEKIFFYLSIPIDEGVQEFIHEHESDHVVQLVNQLCASQMMVKELYPILLLLKVSQSVSAKLIVQHPNLNISQLPLSLRDELQELLANPIICNHLIMWRLNAVALDPALTKDFAPLLFELREVNMAPGGRPVRSWSQLTKELSPAGLANMRFPNRSVLLERPSATPYSTEPPSLLGWEFKMALSRTLIFQNSEGRCLALKIQKRGVDKSELFQEKHMTTLLHSHYRLRSKLPRPGEIHAVRNIRDFLLLQCDIPEKISQAVQDAICKDRDCYVYVYETDNIDYFTYLHDPCITDEDFRAINFDTLEDLIDLLQDNIVYHQLGDMFHSTDNDRGDLGRYQVLVDLIQDRNEGFGVVLGWLKGIEFPNLRASGLADLGDCTTVKRIYASSGKGRYSVESSLESRYKDCYRKLHNPKRAESYILYNTISEYLLIFHLIAGARGVKLSEQMTPQQSKAMWVHLAEQAVKNCILVASRFTNLPRDTARDFILTTVDVATLARQMHFWMTNEYIPFIQTEAIPEDVYGASVKATTDYLDLMSETWKPRGLFHPDIGFARFREKGGDLGVMLSSNPILEFEKLLYAMIFFIHVKNTQHMDTRGLKNELAMFLKSEDYLRAKENIDMQRRLFTSETPYTHILDNLAIFVEEKVTNMEHSDSESSAAASSETSHGEKAAVELPPPPKKDLIIKLSLFNHTQDKVVPDHTVSATTAHAAALTHELGP